MELGPLQQPHPPLWYGAHSPDSAERAARKGLNIVTNDMPENAGKIVARYRQVWRETQAWIPLPKMGLVRFIVVAETDAKAMDIARRAYLRWRSSFVYLSEMQRLQAGLAVECRELRHRGQSGTGYCRLARNRACIPGGAACRQRRQLYGWRILFRRSEFG